MTAIDRFRTSAGTPGGLILVVLLISMSLQARAQEKCGLAFRLSEKGIIGKEYLPAGLTFAQTKAAYHTSRIIGRFEFFYDTTGTDSPAMLSGNGTRLPGSHEAFVDSAGMIFNEVYSTLTGTLGYGDPIQPTQPYYEVYIFDSPYYGETEFGPRIGTSTPARYMTHINLENDFRNFYSPGIAGLRVTAAHEFYHAVQLGVYGIWNSDVYFLEMTSTWMEDVIYDDINDYYQYIRGPFGGAGFETRGHFSRPDISITTANGLIEYSRAIFGKFIEKRYSPRIIRTAWELIPTRVAIQALDVALAGAGSSFREAFLTWNFWNSVTGPDADTAAHYSEGREYPRIRTRAITEYLPPGRLITDSIHTLGSVYYPILVDGNPMMTIISNIRTGGSSQLVSFDYEMAETGDHTYKQLSNGLFVKLHAPDPENWSTHESAGEIIPGVIPAPNPYIASESGAMNFQIPTTEPPSNIRLKVLSTSMQEVFDGAIIHRADLSTLFIQVAEWDGADRWGRPVSSGVYYYILNVDGTEHTGKFAVVN